nr:MAG TPA: hypothetical protein [Caudoviricetes sp.]
MVQKQVLQVMLLAVKHYLQILCDLMVGIWVLRELEKVQQEHGYLGVILLKALQQKQKLRYLDKR